jgi:hypothetical protein
MSDKAENFYKDAKYLATLPPGTADRLNEISYDKLDTSDQKMVLNNFVAWLKNGKSNPSFPVQTDYCSVQDPGWMYHLEEGSNEKEGMLYMMDVFAIHTTWWEICELKGIAVTDCCS